MKRNARKLAPFPSCASSLKTKEIKMHFFISITIVLTRGKIALYATCYLLLMNDDQIASYVGAREETVKEWRLGLRKPRGENICRKLGRFELDFGRWKFRS